MVLRCASKRRAFQSARAEALERRTLLSVSLLTSILPAPNYPAELGGRAFWWTRSQIQHVQQVWVSDGTPAGTVQFTTVPGIEGPQGPPVASGNHLYFGLLNGDDQLWVTDGTAAGTHLILDLGVWPWSFSLADFRGTLYFLAPSSPQESRLWRTDGTVAGTVPVTGPGPWGELLVAGNNLFLDDYTNLFRVNTSGGLDDLGSGTFPNYGYTNFADLGSELYYFRAQMVNGVRHPQLWRSDGTLAGTALVADLAGEPFIDHTNLTEIGGRLVFSFGSDLFSSDGTTAGTKVIANIGAGYITKLNGYAIFLPTDPSHSGIWRTDGTTAGTFMVSENGPPVSPTEDPFSRWFYTAGGLAFYTRLSSTGVLDLWETDGTPGGTSMVANMGNVNTGQQGFILDKAGNYLLFTTPAGIWRVDLLASVSGSVFNDANHNAARDAGEGGLAGVTVYDDANNNGLLDPGEIRATSDSAGAYTLLDVPAIQPAMIRQVAPTGWRGTAPLAASTAVPLITGEAAAGPVFGDVRISTVPIDFAYLLLIGQNFGHAGTFATGDLTDDGRIDFNDLLLAAQSYGRPLPAAAASDDIRRRG